MSQLELFVPDATLPPVGVDEVGRGPLVGNVVAAAVILPSDHGLPVRDSKKLSEKQRQALAEEIERVALDFAYGEATPAEIDALNILQATMLAMRRAIEGLDHPFERILVDGNRCPDRLPCACEAVVKGDDRVDAIAAASILAKVRRDAQMLTLHRQYPEYGFDRHKGYPTKAHLEVLAQKGPIDGVYRTSFAPVRRLLHPGR
ncbi:ribonuclease HII [Sulfurivirga sp.]|uniref:ribonuclease HII n=1 Tax=Sulfurivirga sp. TaxID=2614236 RepID=UPI0025FB0EB8|nr:ribonuclease HII [Sulfurivirga sp.]